MFTGIVQGTAEIIEINKKENFQENIIKLPSELTSGIELGASIANNGCCLTVTKVDGQLVHFDLMQETLKLTNLGLVNIGDEVNIERAAKFGDEIGGHSMSGHIMTMATVKDIIKTPNNCKIYFELPSKYMKYVFEKGFIGIDGISLTIGDVEGNAFSVNLIPETLQRTNIDSRVIGDSINIEIDPQTQAVVETVERMLAKQAG